MDNLVGFSGHWSNYGLVALHHGTTGWYKVCDILLTLPSFQVLHISALNCLAACYNHGCGLDFGHVPSQRRLRCSQCNTAGMYKMSRVELLLVNCKTLP